jgi:hypothetical protein
MKAAMVLVLALASILVLTSLTCPISKTEKTPEGKSTVVSFHQNAAANDNVSPDRHDEVTGSVEDQRAGGSASAGNSKATDDPVSNLDPVETPNHQEVFNASGNHAESADMPPPDGRVYTGGEEPYAYIPTYSPKEKLPIVPLPPDQ